MNNRIKKTISMLLLVCYSTLVGQSNYPYFNDPKKQLTFEKYRVYIIEEKGTDTFSFGGGSRTELANPIQSIFGKEEPQYVAKHDPVRSFNVDYHNFKMEQNGREISEIDLLSLLSLEDEKNNILYHYNQQIDLYEKKVALIKANPFNVEYKNLNLLQNESYSSCAPLILIVGGISTLMSVIGLIIGEEGFDGGNGSLGFFHTITSFSFAYFILGSIPVETKVVEEKPYPKKPILSQTMSINQLKALVETYNHNLYNQIQGGN